MRTLILLFVLFWEMVKNYKWLWLLLLLIVCSGAISFYVLILLLNLIRGII